MPLGFSAPVGEGDIVDIIKYDAKSGRLFRIDRGDGEKIEEDITDSFAAVFDFANIQQGWAIFTPGSAPQWHMAHHSQPYPAKPPEGDWKQGFKMRVLLSKNCGAKDGDVRELSGTSNALKEAIGALFCAWEVEGNDDLLPVVKLNGTERRKTKHGPLFVPRFEIVAWKERPAELKGRGTRSAPASPSKPASADTPPETGSTPMAPAAQEPAEIDF